MVDVSAKSETRREATARAFVELSQETLAALPKNPKGNPLEVARFAGIQAAKQTSALIPMCHPLPLSFVDVSATIVDGGINVLATAATVAVKLTDWPVTVGVSEELTVVVVEAAATDWVIPDEVLVR